MFQSQQSPGPSVACWEPSAWWQVGGTAALRHRGQEVLVVTGSPAAWLPHRHVPDRHHPEEERGQPDGPRRVEGRGLRHHLLQEDHAAPL